MESRWHILYRGPLSSCNYGCNYCPFAKRTNTVAELREDALKLERFIDWIGQQDHREIGVLFTPWGEALIHRAYQDALRHLGDMPHVYRAAIQTNLSGPLDWVAGCNAETVALWCTWHPSEVSMDRFLNQCARLDDYGMRYSVGVVGIREAFAKIQEFRQRLPSHVYLWINAYKDEPDYYTPEEVTALEAIDPHFRLNTHFYPSLGKSCEAGSTSFTVDGEGLARRCHFIQTPLGNIYDPGFEEGLLPRPCTQATCECHIGYVHLQELNLYSFFGDGLLERVPETWNQASPR